MPDVPVRVLLVDDYGLVRAGLRAVLDTPHIEVVGEASTGKEAIERVRELSPDIVLMDVQMPDMDGLAATEAIKAEFPSVAVVILTSFDDVAYLERAIRAGASGYLIKVIDPALLQQAVWTLCNGESLIDTKLMARLLAKMAPSVPIVAGAADDGCEALGTLEREVLKAIVNGRTNGEIATDLHYSVGTVKNAVQRIIEKLGVSDRTQAAVYAVRHAL